MRMLLDARLATLNLATLAVLSSATLYAQAPPGVALKSGESIELMPIYWVLNCRSILVGLPDIEVMEGPSEVALSIKQDMVLPRAQNCANKVSGGKLFLTAKDIQEPKEGRLTYRLKYKTKDGDRQRSHSYNVLLYP